MIHCICFVLFHNLKILLVIFAHFEPVLFSILVEQIFNEQDILQSILIFVLLIEWTYKIKSEIVDPTANILKIFNVLLTRLLFTSSKNTI